MTEALQTLLASAMASDIFAGGLALGTIGVTVALGRTAVGVIGRLLSRRLWAQLALDNRSPAYRHLSLWMEANGVLTHVRQVRLTDTRWNAGTSGYAPAPGKHWFVVQGHLARLTRSINEKARVGGSHDQRPMEVLEIGMLFGSVSTLTSWIKEGARIAAQRDRSGPMLHILRDGYWDDVGEVPRRTIDSVVVEDGRALRVLEDMRWFYAASDWYAERGVPWRRGCLFYGPPGTGKSNLIRALTSELGLDIATLDVGRTTLTDDALREAMMSAPKRSLIAIEDVDAVFSQREAGDLRGGISFSGLLNAIDGVGAQEGRALVMTTNHLDRLDPVLIRPGRADLHVEMGLIGAGTARRLFERFFPGEIALAPAFERVIGQERLSPAVVQGWLLAHRDNPGVAARADALAPVSVRVATAAE
ncbi:AAA family ATPase [Sinirhodobacter populi]|uniref:AAA family ATPase n=1 Tax=Paenirhodobacter populi TaxID=2306993 RepID=A0A443KE78_9RHOB|nr:AAA family ATPase [Sinirhodobacter populi]RWR31127.1 AAA family ATPase [Sinirhodobacter populi]